MAEPGSFDVLRDVYPLRGSYFPSSSSSAGTRPSVEPDGLTGFQRQFLTNTFMTQVLPVQKELEALEERRKVSRFNDIRLEEQTLQLETLREQTKNNRDILTRLPFVMQELEGIVNGGDADPVAAASSLVQTGIKNAELFALNPAARVMYDATQQQIQLKNEKKKADDAATLARGSKFAVMPDPGLSARGDELLTQMGTPEAMTALQDAKLIREAAQRDIQLAAEKQGLVEKLQYLEDSQKALEGIEADAVDSTDYATGIVTKTYVYPPEVKSLLDRLTANLLPGAEPEQDVPKRVNQLFAGIQQERLKLLTAPKDSKDTTSTPSTMRGSTTKP